MKNYHLTFNKEAAIISALSSGKIDKMKKLIMTWNTLFMLLDFSFLNSIKKCEIMLGQVQNEQEEFYKYLKNIKVGNKSEGQRKTLANIT